MSKGLILAVITLLFILSGCALDQATLVSNNVSKEYLNDKYGEITYTNLYFTPKYDFDESIRVAREGILSSDRLSNSEKETLISQMRPFNTYAEKQYLTFFFRLKSPTIVKKGDIMLSFNNMNGNTIIDQILFVPNKVTIEYKGSTSHSYNYAWIVKLKKPFTKENFPDGNYKVIVSYPNGQSTIYKVTSR